MRAPKLAHSSPATRTITLKDENFSRSQVASFAIHGSLALLLFMTFVARPPFIPKIPPKGIDRIFAPPTEYLHKLLAPREVPGNHGAGGGGERSAIHVTVGQIPSPSAQQIMAPSVHTFPNSVMLLEPTVVGAQNLSFPNNNLPNWGDPNSNVRTNSDGSGCCLGMGDGGKGSGIGPGRGKGAGPGKDGDGIGSSPVGPPGNGVRFPSCQYCPRPEYSDEARRVHYQGLVMLNVVVLPDGRVGRIELVTGPGLGLDDKAIEAVRNWRFNPAIGPKGKAIAVVIPVEVQFQLF
jgi:TonB family protein